MNVLAHLDQRIAEADAAVARAGLPLREWDGPMTIRVWQAVTERTTPAPPCPLVRA